MKFIKLVSFDEKPIYVNADAISYMKEIELPKGKRTAIYLRGESSNHLIVEDSVDSILEKISTTSMKANTGKSMTSVDWANLGKRMLEKCEANEIVEGDPLIYDESI